MPRPGEVTTDKHTDELEAGDSTSAPWIERGVVLASCCQDNGDLLSVGSLIVVGDEAQDGGVVVVDDVGAACGHTFVNKAYRRRRRTEYAALRVSGVQGQGREGPILTTWGLSIRNCRIS